MSHLDKVIFELRGLFRAMNSRRQTSCKKVIGDPNLSSLTDLALFAYPFHQRAASFQLSCVLNYLHSKVAGVGHSYSKIL